MLHAAGYLSNNADTSYRELAGIDTTTLAPRLMTFWQASGSSVGDQNTQLMVKACQRTSPIHAATSERAHTVPQDSGIRKKEAEHESQLPKTPLSRKITVHKTT